MATGTDKNLITSKTYFFGEITNGNAENIKLLNKVTYKRGGGTFQESILLQSDGFTLVLVDK